MSDKAVAEPRSVQELITDRIKKDFVELMPEDTFKKLVDQVVEDFTTDDTRYSSNVKPSQFKKLVESIMIKEHLSPRIIEALKKHPFSERFDAAGKDIADRALKQFILENADMILANLMSNLAGDMLMSFRNEFQQKLQNMGQY